MSTQPSDQSKCTLLQALRQELAELVAQSRGLRIQAHKLRAAQGAQSGPQRHILNLERRDLRPVLRLRQLALAFLRCRSYASVERTSATVPDPAAIAQYASDAGATPELVAALKAWLEARGAITEVAA